MKKINMTMAVLCLMTTANAGVTTHFRLDCRTGIREPSLGGEVLRYDASWYENGDSVRITENGALVTDGTAGCYTWYPGTSNSARLLKLEVLSNGKVVGTETALFGFGYVRNVTARQLWPHKKVEVCYTLADDIGEIVGETEALALTAGLFVWKSDNAGKSNSVSSYSTTVLGASEVSFKWKVSSEGNYDFLRFYVDGAEAISAISGSVDWSLVTIHVSSETQHTLTWSYEKDRYTDGGSDCGWVSCIMVDGKMTVPDGFVFEPLYCASHVIGDKNCSPGSHCVVWDVEADGISDDSSELSFGVSVMNATPGFVAKTFSAPSLTFDKTSDVWGAPVSYVSSPDGLYATSLAEHTTVAYGCYMWMVGGVTYSFKGRYDDYVGVKVGANWIMSNSSECNEASGSFTPSTTGYYPVEFRAGNNGGVGGIQNSNQYGIKWCTSVNGTWRNVGNTDSETVFFVNRTDGEFAVWTGTSSMISVNLSSEVKDGMEVTGTVEWDYSTIGTGSVTLEVNGRLVHSSTEGGMYTWTPPGPGTYVLTQRAGDSEFSRRVLCPASDDAKELEIGWLDKPVSNYFPNVYASVTNVVIAPTLTHLPENAFAGCEGLKFEVKDGIVYYKGCVLGVEGECPANVVLPEGTQAIADGAFRNCSTLVGISIPPSVKEIGAYAFENCTELEEIVIPEGVEVIGDGAFLNCTWMQEVEFPSTLKSIGKFAFGNCTMLESVDCLDGLESVGECAFSNCWRMLSVAFPSSVDEIGAHAFYNCKGILGVTVPAHVDTIAHLFPDVYQKLQSVYIAEGETELTAGVFSGCQLLEEVELSDAIQEIPDSTFEGCSLLRSIRFPNDLVRIGNRAFYGCGQIWQLEFPQGLTEIGDDAFNGVQWVQDLVCPASVRRIGARAFRGVWNDEEVKLPLGLEWLGVDAFANCGAIRKISLPAVTTPIKSAFPAAYSKINSVKILGAPTVIPANFCQDVVSLSGIAIPASVTNIGNYAFSGLSNLAAIELPPNLESIGEYAFNGDNRFVTVALPQSLKSVGYRAFYGCGNVRIVSCSGELATLSYLFPSAYGQITTVSINKGTTRLMDDLLSGCSKLSEIDAPLGVTSIGARAFQNCTALTAFGVPQGVVTLGADVFSGCTGLTSMSLPEGLTSIPSGAFRNCRAIASLVIPSSVTYLGSDAFNGCTALKSISYLGSCPTFDSGCYNGTPSDLASHVVFGSRGWDGVPTSKTLPEYWPTTNPRTIDYWTPNTFEATFDGNGGTPASANVVQTTGMTYVLPEDDPAMKGARFNGWWTQRINGGRIKSTTKVEVTRAQTFYAHWKYNEYAVRFGANGGFGEMDDLPLTVNTAAELTKNAFLRKGYRFAGWALSPEGETELLDGAEVENLSFEHNAVVTLYAVWEEQDWGAAEYLNVPGREFAFEGDADWVADDVVSHDGVGSMRSGAIAAAEEGQRTRSVMKTVVVGTGTGSFWWKVDCEPAEDESYYDYCSFTIDGTEVAKIAGMVDWEKVEYEITGGGEHVLAWTFTRDDYDEDESLYENAAWGDEFAWTPTPVTLSFDANGAEGEVPSAVTKYAGYEVTLPSPSLLTKNGFVFVGWSDGVETWHPGNVYTLGASDTTLCAVWEEKVWTLEEAAGLTGLTLTTGGDAAWTVDLTTNYDGVASIRSGAIGDSQSSWVSMSVTGPGTISFRTLVSGEYYRGKLCDYLKFEVDGAETFASYDANWSNVVVEVSGKGSHTLKWTYLKNASKSAGYDCAWLDEIVWTSTTSYTVHFNANGGSGEMSTMSCLCGAAYTLPACTFTREGYSFSGWATSSSGEVAYAAGATVSDLTTTAGAVVTLYAVWEYLPIVNPVITPADGATFDTDSCTVTITCASVDAVIYYSTNGCTPSTTEANRYTGPFTISKTTTIKAVAVRGKETSAYISATLTKVDPTYVDAEVGKDVTGRDEPVVVPATWVTESLAQRFGAGKEATFRQMYGNDLAAALAKPTGKVGQKGEALTVWDDYVAGTDPTDPTSVFTTSIEIVDGNIVITWSPNLNDGSTNRIYTLSGREDLTTGDWEAPAQPWHRFFMVSVALPTGAAEEESAVSGQGFVPDEKSLGGVQLWENGPYWAECNVGASKPEEYGYYFWWGDTVGYKRNAGDNGWVSVKDGTSYSFCDCPTDGMDNSQLQSAGYIDSTGNLVAAHDAATAHLGAPWRMPTDAEFSALISNCDTQWTTRGGVYGRLVTGRGAYASKSIFLPAAGGGYDSNLNLTGSYGLYWSSSPYSDYSNDAWYLGFYSSYFSRYYYDYRYDGQSVRPLRGFAK